MHQNLVFVDDEDIVRGTIMSGGGYNWMPPPENWSAQRSYGERGPNRHHALSRLLTLRSPLDTGEAALGYWWLPEERVVTGPLGATRFPLQPQASMQFFILDSPAPFTNQRNMQLPTQQEDDSKLSKEEQRRVLSKLKKKIYNPSLKNLSKRFCLYYRNNAQTNYNNSDKARNETDDDGKRCAVCLEDFETREEVTTTPCNHMFHDDCIVPWVKSHGQCPVCRLIV